MIKRGKRGENEVCSHFMNILFGIFIFSLFLFSVFKFPVSFLKDISKLYHSIHDLYEQEKNWHIFLDHHSHHTSWHHHLVNLERVQLHHRHLLCQCLDHLLSWIIPEKKSYYHKRSSIISQILLNSGEWLLPFFRLNTVHFSWSSLILVLQLVLTSFGPKHLLSY